MLVFGYRRFLCSILSSIIILSLLATPLLTFVQYAGAESNGWWNSGWEFRKAIDINRAKVSGSLENLPVLVDIVDSGLANAAQTRGEDIAFVDGLGNKLDHEIEYFDVVTGRLAAWVRLPFLSSDIDMRLYMYYGNPAAENQQNPNSVWSNGHVMVHHFEETSGVNFDSTSYGNNGVSFNGVSQGTTGKIDGGDVLDGVDDYVEVPHSNSISGFARAFTSSFWVKLASSTKRQSILNKYNTVNDQRGWFIDYQNHPSYGKVLGFFASRDGVDFKQWYAPLNPLPNAWHFIAVVWQANMIPRFYVDGQQVSIIGNSAIPVIFNNVDSPLHIGKSTYVLGREFKGSIDEVTISNTACPANWILTCYNNQKDPSTFYSIGNEEAYSGALSVSNEQPRNKSTDVYTNPKLSVRVTGMNGDFSSVMFSSNTTGIWRVIRSYDNVRDGEYSCIPTDMNKLGVTYHWRVSATDGQSWVNKTYSFTTTTTILKLKWSTYGLPPGASSVLIADVNRDGLEEVVYVGGYKGNGSATLLNGTDGRIIWSVQISGLDEGVQPQMADLTRDGIPEIIVPIQAPAGVHVLHASNGSTFWRNTGLGGQSWATPVVADIYGDGYPIIFVSSTDILSGLNGSGRISALSHDGKVLYQTFVWRPCAGGLSIADTDGDGEFELYMGDRHMYMSDPGYGKGIQSFWARNLTQRWEHPDILSSSHIPMLADVDKDGKLDVIAGDQRGGIVVLNSTDGSAIRKTTGIPNNAPIHYQPSVYDVDNDGNLEILMADGFHDITTNDTVIWDLVQWKVDGRLNLGRCKYGPQVADITGDGVMEIIACGYSSIFVLNNTYSLVAQVNGLTGILTYPVMQDIDGDGYFELVVTSSYPQLQRGIVYAFDTPARRQTLRPRSEVQFYSERRLGAAEYVPPPGCQQPLISALSVANGAIDVPITLSRLSFNLIDYQYDKMNFSVSTMPHIGSYEGINVNNGRHTVTISNLDYTTTYTWFVSVTDGTNWSNKSFTFSTCSQPPWWNTSWRYRRAITIDPSQVSSDQTNFPVLIHLTDSNLSSRARTDGYDFVFTDSNQNKLNHQIEFYNNAAGRLVAWVNVPFLSSSTYTRLYMYYGNPAATNQQSPAAVWNSNHRLVLHLSETSGVQYDSTMNGNNGTPMGGLAQGIEGKIGGADRFDGINDCVEIPHSNTISGFTTGFTIDFWLKLEDSTRRQTILNKYNTAGNQRGWFVEFQIHSTRGKVLGFFASPNGVTYSEYYASFNPIAGEWYYITIVWESNLIPKFYINGVQVPTIGTARISSIFNNTGTPLHIGRSIYTTDRYLRGFLDEIRISSPARSPSWILTCYNNQKASTTFYTIADQEQLPEKPIISVPSPLWEATDVPASLFKLSFNLFDYQGDLMNYTVVTDPDIGAGYGVNVGNERYNVEVSNLRHATTYRWKLSVTDGKGWTNKTFTFATEPMPLWWNTIWQYRRTITIDPAKVSSNLTNFPVLISLSDISLAGKAQPDGDDFVFVDASTGMKLDHKIEFYESATGRLVAWTNVPLLSSTRITSIHMYYGNPNAENQQNPTAAWDPSYKMVLHLDESTGVHYDSTRNGNNGTPYNGVIQGVTGVMGGAISFDGVNDYVSVLHSSSLDLKTSLTLEAWVYRTRAADEWIIAKNYDAFANTQYGIFISNSHVISLVLNGAYRASITLDTRGRWAHIVGTWDGGTARIFVDGVLRASASYSVVLTSQPYTLTLGCRKTTAGVPGIWWLKGSIDEIRVSNASRTAGWILASFNNQKAPSTFYMVGGEETLSQAPIISALSPSNFAPRVPFSISELGFNLIDFQRDQMNFTVTITPNIGSGSGINFRDGRYTISISNLTPSTTYTWQANVTDGTNWTNATFRFTTYPGAPPTHNSPLLISSQGTNRTNEYLTCYNQTSYDPDEDRVTNVFNWNRNNASITNLLLPFETNSSTVTKDYSTYGHDGVIVRGVTWVQNGKVGGAYRFERGYIRIPGKDTLDGGGRWSEITVEHWIYITAYRSGTRTISKIPSFEIGLSWNKIFAGIWVDTGKYNVSGYNRVTYDTPLNKDSWYHIVLTYKSGVGLTLYINGLAVAAKPVSGNIQASRTEPVYLGWFDYFSGMIDEVRMYPKSLSPQQIYQRYIETKDGLSNSSTIVPQETQIGDIWKCQVTPNDSYQDGSAKFSNTVTIVENNKPAAYNLTITPTTPNTSNNLTASYTYFDPDGDPENITMTEIRWYKNGVLQPELNNTLTVPHYLTAEGETWYFTVRPHDGKEYGETQTSANVTIQNTPPEITSYYPLTNPTINETQSQTFNVTCSDIDNDTLTITWYIYYSNGTLRDQTTGESYTFQSNIGDAGTYTIIVKVSDGESEASHQWILTIQPQT